MLGGIGGRVDTVGAIMGGTGWVGTVGRSVVVTAAGPVGIDGRLVVVTTAGPVGTVSLGGVAAALATGPTAWLGAPASTGCAEPHAVTSKARAKGRNLRDRIQPPPISPVMKGSTTLQEVLQVDRH